MKRRVSDQDANEKVFVLLISPKKRGRPTPLPGSWETCENVHSSERRADLQVRGCVGALCLDSPVVPTQNWSELLKARRKIPVSRKTKHIIGTQQQNRSEPPSQRGTTALDSQYTEGLHTWRRVPKSSSGRAIDGFFLVRCPRGKQYDVSFRRALFSTAIK